MSNMVIRTNVLSLNSHRNLGMTGNMQARASGRLSSGFRINSAADDAAGLGISEKMRGQIRGLDQASRNAQDGISLIQTAEGAMQTVNDMVIRIRELVIQAANDTNVHDNDNVPQSDRARIQDEINQLLDEIDAISARTEFNTRTLLDGSLGGAIASVASAATQNVVLTVGVESAASIDSVTASAVFTLTVSGSLAVPGDTAASSIQVTATGSFIAVSSVASVSAATANITVTRPADAGVSSVAGNSLWFHIGANENQGVIFRLEDVSVAALQLNGLRTFTDGNELIGGDQSALTAPNAGVMSEDGQYIGSGGDADGSSFISTLDNALSIVTQQRSLLGAMQNRLEFTIENLDIASENLQAANSRIRDADMAREMMTLTQMNVLQQAATAMLAQANQAPQMVLQLLG